MRVMPRIPTTDRHLVEIAPAPVFAGSSERMTDHLPSSESTRSAQVTSRGSEVSSERVPAGERASEEEPSDRWRLDSQEGMRCRRTW